MAKKDKGELAYRWDPKPKPAPDWMKRAIRVLKPGTCYWEGFRQMYRIKEVSIDHTGKGDPILVIGVVTMEVHPLDGLPMKKTTTDYYRSEVDYKQLLNKRQNPKKYLKLYNRYYKKIYLD
jgi:hypothetical protein